MKGKIGARFKKITTKFVASTLIVTLTYANFFTLGDFLVSYAAQNDGSLDKQTDATLNKNVKFDAYFNENENLTHYKTADLNNDEAELIMATHIQKEGYLKNATIDLKNENGENELNYTITDLEDTNAIVQSASENQLVLRQINSGDKIEIKAKIAPNNISNVENLRKDSKLILKGLYIDGQGKETPIEKEIKINIGWQGKYEAEIKQSLTKYIPIIKEDGNKVLISEQIETGLKSQKYMLPINETNLEVEVPIINGERPTSVTVNAISTQATNGQTSEDVGFNEDNWKYTESDSKIQINVKNENKKQGQNSDIYLINYIYSENVYNQLKNKMQNIQLKSKVKISTYSSEGINECEGIANDQITLSDSIGKLISMQGEKITEKISKGKFYANINNPENPENTEYEYKWNINVGYSEGLNGIVIKNKQEKMTAQKSMIGNLNGKTIYKQITINSSSFDELLGDEGKISIYNNEGRLLALIAKDSRTDKDGNYVVEFLEEVSDIKLVTSKPLKNGNITMSIKKEIKSDLGFTKSQIDNFEQIDILSEIYQIDEKTNEETLVEEKDVSIPLEATVTKSQISINKDKLSTLVKNENVEMTIELGNDNETSDLYVDPIFEIELPKEIENVEILESKILFDDELLIKNIEFIHQDGVPVLRVMLDGVQTKYSDGVVTNGTNIVIKMNIEVNKLSPTKTEEIKMYYYNSNTVNYENGIQTDKGLGGLATTNIEIVAPTGMIAINGMTNYDGNNNTITTLNQGDVMNQVETYKPARIIRMTLTAINNTGNTCDNLVILGRLPFTGNKDLENGEDLGTTLDTYLRSYITSESLEGDGLVIYYSENGEATTAPGDSANGWTTEPTDLSKIKSYMIVLNGYEMQQGSQITFSYDFEIPKDIGYNQTINSNYGIYYVNNTQVASVSSFAKADRIGITTGRGPELNITQSVEGAREDGTVRADRILKYTINVTNTGTENAEGVFIRNEIPKWTTLVRQANLDTELSTSNIEEYISSTADAATMSDWNVIENGDEENGIAPTVGWNIDCIRPGETITKEVYILTQLDPDIYSYYNKYPGFEMGEDGKYYITANKYNADTDSTEQSKTEITDVPEIEYQNITLVSAQNINTVLKSSSDVVNEEKSNGLISVEEEVEFERENFAIESEEVVFSIKIMTEDELENIKIEKILPEELTYVSSKLLITEESGETTNVDGNYDESTRTITISKDYLGDAKAVAGQINVTINKLNDSEYEKEIKTNSKINYQGVEEIYTDEVSFLAVKPQYTIKQECNNTSARINTGDEIEYKITVTNIGKVEISKMQALTCIPENFFINEILYTQYGQTAKTHSKQMGEDITQILDIPVGGTVEILMKFKVTAVEEDTDVMLYTNISGDTINSTTTDIIMQTIEQDEKYKNNDNNGNNNNGNNNGNNTPTEKTYKISGMAWDDKNENGQKDDGENLLEGIVVNLIDTNGNIVTDSATSNSIEATTDKDGKYLLTNVKPGRYMVVFRYDANTYTTTSYQKANVSELYNSNAIEKEITINGEKIVAGITDLIDINSTTININLGLASKLKFDLKLEKYVSKVTVQNSKGVKSYDFDNSKLAKVEIPSSEMAKSTVVIEYKILVTNEGNVSGYAKNIVDYKPNDTNFNSSLNTNWYAGSDGCIYSKSLENEVINPGETKEIKLVLTKQMNANNTGIINNTAEIKESYNEQGLEDRDSTPGNKAQGEDDIGLADTIISVKTGGPAFYIMLGIVILVILSVGIYFMKTKLLKSKEVYR